MEELYLLRAFVAAAHYRSFTKAAEALGVSTGSVSKAISKLEDNVQARLLHRTTRSVALTEPAQSYYLSCRRLLDELDEANRRMRREGDVDSGNLRLAVHPLVVGHLFSALLAQYREFAPNINLMVSVREGPVNLYEGKYDVAIQLAALVEQAAVIRRTLLTTPRIMVATPRYLELHGMPKCPADLSQHLLLLPSHQRQRHSDWVELIENGESARVKPFSSIDGNDVLLRTSAHASVGIAALPEFMIREDIGTGQLVHVLPNCGTPDGDLELCLFYPYRDLLPMRLRSFVDFCTAFFRDNESRRRRPVHTAIPDRVSKNAPLHATL
ncbi:LysR family transcriptional regulator [Paraburkholderia sp. MMS20-SJTN17]|uniref:LysR family transcriptional regulator n=1 Tax=Paraburkholderia translucens TaxID=2886945 RepID=A0ABS8KIQ0_9BURK|nr:LysR family transcriptional regulator [Paraburkholderia sp. MMS20-SJTN17]MCC8404651.1 LysR family transcriptional regulator [Paraburkholderia sp. MMS20-SJTN17]